MRCHRLMHKRALGIKQVQLPNTVRLKQTQPSDWRAS